MRWPPFCSMPKGCLARTAQSRHIFRNMTTAWHIFGTNAKPRLPGMISGSHTRRTRKDFSAPTFLWVLVVRAQASADRCEKRTRSLASFLGVLAVVGDVWCTRNPCDVNNLSVPEAPPIITVVNAATGQSICDATILATCLYRDAGIPLVTDVPPDASGAACQYGVAQYWADGSLEAAVPLMELDCTLHVSKQGFASVAVPNVSPQGDGCTAGTSQHVNVELQPN